MHIRPCTLWPNTATQNACISDFNHLAIHLIPYLLRLLSMTGGRQQGTMLSRLDNALLKLQIAAPAVPYLAVRTCPVTAGLQSITGFLFLKAGAWAVMTTFI